LAGRKVKEKRWYYLEGSHAVTITLELPPELESQLVAEASDKGIPLAEVIRLHLAMSHASGVRTGQMTTLQRERALDELFDSMAAPAGIRESAFHRENWYR
jgi:hypothetical protein